MTIQFVHRRRMTDTYEFAVNPRGGETIASEQLDTKLFKKLDIGDSVTLKLGVAICSTDDNYCRKTGREIALTRLVEKELKVIQVHKRLDNKAGAVSLKDEEGNTYIHSLKEGSLKVHFIEVV